MTMQFKIPKNTDKYHWTLHSIEKMNYYRLSAQRVLRVIKNPQRVEEGIVEKTIAVMQPASTRGSLLTRGGPSSTQRGKNGKKTWSSEIWVMYQISTKGGKVKSSKLKVQSDIKNLNANKLIKLSADWQTKKLRIISAWRYPGISPKKDPIPSEILEEIENIV